MTEAVKKANDDWRRRLMKWKWQSCLGVLNTVGQKNGNVIKSEKKVVHTGRVMLSHVR